jgi:hypothetical protein
VIFRIPIDRINWTTSAFLIGIFILTLTAVPLYLWHFGVDWFHFAISAVLLFATGFSITLGYHRLFSHATFRARLPVRLFTLIFGAAAFENSVAPLGEIPKEFQPAVSKKEEKPTSTESSKNAATSDLDDSDDDDNDDAAAQSKAAGLYVKDLALTKDASDVEYKALVEQLGFKNKAKREERLCRIVGEPHSPRLDEGRQRSDHAGLCNIETQTGRCSPYNLREAGGRRERSEDDD